MAPYTPEQVDDVSAYQWLASSDSDSTDPFSDKESHQPIYLFEG